MYSQYSGNQPEVSQSNIHVTSHQVCTLYSYGPNRLHKNTAISASNKSVDLSWFLKGPTRSTSNRCGSHMGPTDDVATVSGSGGTRLRSWAMYPHSCSTTFDLVSSDILDHSFCKGCIRAWSIIMYRPLIERIRMTYRILGGYCGMCREKSIVLVSFATTFIRSHFTRVLGPIHNWQSDSTYGIPDSPGIYVVSTREGIGFLVTTSLGYGYYRLLRVARRTFGTKMNGV